MKEKVISGLLLFSILIPTYQASDSQSELDTLTKEQKQIQQDIEDKATEITDAQVSLDSLQSTIESNQTQIDQLTASADAKQTDINNQLENLKSTLQLMQKLSNQNAMLTYLTSNDEQNFFLKCSNVLQLSISIQDQITSFSNDLKSINSDLDQVSAYQEQNKQSEAEQASLLADQQSTEDELREQLSQVDSDVISVQTQISLEQAQQMQAEQQAKTEAAAAKKEEEAEKAVAKETEDTQVDDTETVETEEPEEPETVDPVEPEEPETVDPVEPEEPEEPETGGDSGYPSDGNVSGQKNQIMAAAGISSSDYTYVDYIITKESSWNYLNSNSYSGAYGLCQALPGSKMAAAGSDWATNPETQMIWCNGYATSRYGSWEAAYNFWLENNWW